MDAVDPGTVDQAMAAIRSVEGGSAGSNDLRLRWIGHGLRAEADVTVPSDLTALCRRMTWRIMPRRTCLIRFGG